MTVVGDGVRGSLSLGVGVASESFCGLLSVGGSGDGDGDAVVGVVGSGADVWVSNLVWLLLPVLGGIDKVGTTSSVAGGVVEPEVGRPVAPVGVGGVVVGGVDVDTSKPLLADVVGVGVGVGVGVVVTDSGDATGVELVRASVAAARMAPTSIHGTKRIVGCLYSTRTIANDDLVYL